MTRKQMTFLGVLTLVLCSGLVAAAALLPPDPESPPGEFDWKSCFTARPVSWEPTDIISNDVSMRKVSGFKVTVYCNGDFLNGHYLEGLLSYDAVNDKDVVTVCQDDTGRFWIKW